MYENPYKKDPYEDNEDEEDDESKIKTSPGAEQSETEKSSHVEKERVLDLNYLRKILFLSYKFSQGNPGLQYEIFQYIHVLHPDWKMDNELKSKALEEIRRLAKQYIPYSQSESEEVNPSGKLQHASKGSTDTITEKQIDDDVQSRIEEIQQALNERTPYKDEKDEIVRKITDITMRMDHRYLSRPEGRTRGEIPKDRQTPQTDPFISFLCYYGLQGNLTGLEEFDAMFKDVSGVVLEDGLAPDPVWHKTKLDKFHKIIGFYNEHHPENPADLKKLRAETTHAQ